MDRPAGAAAHPRSEWDRPEPPPVPRVGPARLVEIFGDHPSARHGRVTFLDQHRRLALGIEREEFLAPFPHAFLNEARCNAEFAKRKPDEARMRTKRVME